MSTRNRWQPWFRVEGERYEAELHAYVASKQRREAAEEFTRLYGSGAFAAVMRENYAAFEEWYREEQERFGRFLAEVTE